MTNPHPGPRVLVDATAVPAHRGGVGRYVDGLLGALAGDILIACQERDAEFYRKLVPEGIVLPQSGISAAPLRLLWEQFRLPTLARRSGAEVIFSPHYTMPLLTGMPRVVTFHDATFFSDPGVHSRLKARFFRAWIRVSAGRAEKVIVPSLATSRELDRFVHRPRGYEVAYHGVNTGVFHRPSRAESEALTEATGLGAVPWIGFLGTIEPRKNLPALVRAYGAVSSGWHRDWGPVPVLAIAGGTGWEKNLDFAIAQIAQPGKVLRLGFIPLETLSAFLGGAELVSYPSLGEGFGLPVLEAMACGSAVLTTDRLAIPEVGGDAVAYSEPTAESIAEGLRALLGDPDERARLRREGMTRSQEFTWKRSAAIHESAFRQATEHSGQLGRDPRPR
jgi:glycosyltransferase involved in cell wall biosynthesis